MGAIGSTIGGIGNLEGIRKVLDGVSSNLAKDFREIPQILQGLSANLASTLESADRAGKGPSSAGVANISQLLSSFQADVTRLAYIAALQAAVKKARGSGPFNFETAVNDLWLALQAIRGAQQQTNPSGPAQMGQLLEMMSNIVKKMNDSAGQAIQNIKG